jgi:hypothetical protein
MQKAIHVKSSACKAPRKQKVLHAKHKNKHTQESKNAGGYLIQ